ncbi:MAG: adenosylcobinamide-GDP ribazoletransferase [Clostridiaceae bacterium]
MIKGLVLSLQFLTRIPLKAGIEMNSSNIAKSTFFFPFVGMLIGTVSASAYYLGLFAGRDAAALCGVIALIFITGGLHIDGLSDTCDGFYSSRDRERILEIMKDSRSGTFGVTAIVLDILAKYVLLSNMQAGAVICLIMACANARLASVMLMSFTKTARPGGLGAMFSEVANKKYFYLGAVIYAAVVILVFGPKFIIVLAAALIAAILVAYKSYRTIGGLTGDVYGAGIEISEIVSIAAFGVVMAWI